MIIAIADDITGAAEIAGIGFRYGLRVKLVMDISQIPTDCDLLVCATDTRSLTEKEAIRQSCQLAEQLHASGYRKIFKKVDSALRGHLVAELQPFLDVVHYNNVLLIPQNPSKGRIIQKGIYYINGVPLHETSFKDDPEFPAYTSEVNCFLKKKNGFVIADATTLDEIEEYATSLPPDTLPAGGADFFSAYLQAEGYILQPDIPTFKGLTKDNVLIVCGSTVRHPLETFGYIQRHQVDICSMPLPVFEGGHPNSWAEELKQMYIQQHSLAITIGHPPQTGKDFADRLKQILTEATFALISIRLPQYLIIEGGATAFSILSRLQCNEFTVKQEIASGVIGLETKQIPGFCIIMKPGSYPWGDTFL